MDSLFSKNIHQLIQHVIYHTLGFRFPDIHGTGRISVFSTVPLHHIWIKIFQLCIFVPVAHGVENRNDVDIVVLSISDKHFPFLRGNRIRIFAGFRIALKGKGILYIGHIHITFYIRQPSDNVLEIFHGGYLSSGNIIGKTAHRHCGFIMYGQRKDFPIVQAEQLP